jgi:hypothetical protein
MTPTLEQLQEWFDEYNRDVFRGELPAVKLTFFNARRTLGQFYWGSGRGVGIKVSLFYDRTEKQFRNTLLHEMCHLYCYCQGWLREHHGTRWKKVAANASRITGMEIRRLDDISGLEPSKGNEKRMQAVEARRNAPALLLDIDHGDYHFLVKLSKKTLAESVGMLRASPWVRFQVYVSDADLFKRWSASRTIHRGYKFLSARYESEIKPLLGRPVDLASLGL